LPANHQTFGSALGLPLSTSVRAGDYVFVSGQLPLDESGQIVVGTIETQTHAVMKKLSEALAMANASLENVVKCTVWLADARDFAGFNKTYLQYFPSNPPARATVRCELLLDARLEIDAIAYAPTAA
jgi:reactive intermediate/imine deaminase